METLFLHIPDNGERGAKLPAYNHN